jgi:hypothetical protein
VTGLDPATTDTTKRHRADRADSEDSDLIMLVPQFVLAAGWIPFAVVFVLSLIFSTAYGKVKSVQ